RIDTRSVSRHRRDHARRDIHLANPDVAKVRYIEIACAIDGHTLGVLELCTGGLTTISRETGGSVACNRRDDSCCRRYFTDPVVVILRDVYVARTVHGLSEDVAYLGARGR